ncbi:hypothetical protein HanPSC8_Chr01g0011081 [Helianthus annuus]|nr:hypothetical protein HanPSC8_Chr01g0011081 [Helianthus annuus]
MHQTEILQCTCLNSTSVLYLRETIVAVYHQHVLAANSPHLMEGLFDDHLQSYTYKAVFHHSFLPSEWGLQGPNLELFLVLP